MVNVLDGTNAHRGVGVSAYFLPAEFWVGSKDEMMTAEEVCQEFLAMVVLSSADVEGSGVSRDICRAAAEP